MATVGSVNCPSGSLRGAAGDTQELILVERGLHLIDLTVLNELIAMAGMGQRC